MAGRGAPPPRTGVLRTLSHPATHLTCVLGGKVLGEDTGQEAWDGTSRVGLDDICADGVCAGHELAVSDTQVLTVCSSGAGGG